MKKIFALILALVFVLSISACGAKNEEPANNETGNNNASTNLDEISLTDIVSQTASASDLEFFSFMTESADSSMAAYLIGTEAIDAPFTEAVAHVPMMNTNPFTMIVFRVAEDQNAQALADELESKADLRKLICVEAEAVDTAVNGNTVLFVMGSQAEVNAILTAFNNI